MMIIIFNNEKKTIAQDSSLQDLLNQHNKSHNYAVAVNRQFVARSQYAQTILKEQDQIDIIQPMQGG